MQGIVSVIVTRATVSIRYPVRPAPAAWIIPEGNVAESPVHHTVSQHLTLLLEAWAARQPAPTRVLRNVAIRWLEEYPNTGIDPDVCVLAPPPPDLDDVSSVCLWKRGHIAPPICFEIVSVNHPYKDYLEIQDRYAALGTRELVVFDPILAGPRSLGGPVALQMWRRTLEGGLERSHFGDAPVFSEVLDAWLIADGRSLHIAEDRHGTRPWLTAAQQASINAERAQADAERAQADAERARAEAERERAQKEEFERRLRELERKLDRG